MNNTGNKYKSLLKVGDTFKSYRALCEHLDEKVKTGKAKQLHTKDWKRFFSSEGNGGYSLIITEVFEEVKEKIDMRTEGNRRAKYIDKIETLILDLLAQNEHNGQVFLSRNKLLSALSMINDNYVYGKTKPFRLSKMMSINPEDIFDFFETSDGMLKRNLMSALDSLKDQSLISYKEIMTICHLEVDDITYENMKLMKSETTDKYGDKTTSFGFRNPNIHLNHRRPTVEEESFILEKRKDLLKRYGCKKVSEVLKLGKGNEFYKELNGILFREANIHFFYNSYEIIFNKRHVLEELEEKERSMIQAQLNEEIIERVGDNAKSRQNNALKNRKENYKEIYETRSKIEYIGNINNLCSKLLDIEADKMFI